MQNDPRKKPGKWDHLAKKRPVVSKLAPVIGEGDFELKGVGDAPVTPEQWALINRTPTQDLLTAANPDGEFVIGGPQPKPVDAELRLSIGAERLLAEAHARDIFVNGQWSIDAESDNKVKYVVTQPPAGVPMDSLQDAASALGADVKRVGKTTIFTIDADAYSNRQDQLKLLHNVDKPLSASMGVQ